MTTEEAQEMTSLFIALGPERIDIALRACREDDVSLLHALRGVRDEMEDGKTSSTTNPSDPTDGGLAGL